MSTDKLTVKQRLILDALDDTDLSTKEIAKLLGVSAEYVRQTGKLDGIELPLRTRRLALQKQLAFLKKSVDKLEAELNNL